MNHFGVLLSLLRDRPTFWNEIRRNVKVERKSLSLLVASCVFFAIYGAIIGSSSSWMQMISSAIKLPALYLITLVICLPTLFFFDVLFGSKLGFGQYIALLLTGMATISVLLFSFAPVTLFFLISIHDYNFFLLVNILIFTLTGLIGIRLFYSGMQQLSYESKAIEDAPSNMLPYDVEYNDRPEVSYSSEKTKRPRKSGTVVQKSTSNQDFEPISNITKNPEDELQKTRDRLLKFWLFLYALVGSQLGWTLRPFFGAPSEPFQLFRPIEGNFYSTVFRILLNFLGLN